MADDGNGTRVKRWARTTRLGAHIGPGAGARRRLALEVEPVVRESQRVLQNGAV